MTHMSDSGDGNHSRHCSSPPLLTERPARTILVRLHPKRVWRWHIWLLESLSAQKGRVVRVAFLEDVTPFPLALRLLLTLERSVLRLSGPQAAELIDASEIQATWPQDDGLFDLIIDLTEAGIRPSESRMLCPLYNGVVGDEALIAAIMAGLDVELTLAGSTRTTAMRPAVDDPIVLTRALNNVFCVILSLCLAEASVARERMSVPNLLTGAGVSVPANAAVVLQFALRMAKRKVEDRLTDLCVSAPRWQVGVRKLKDVRDSLKNTHVIPRSGYEVLSDDGRRYYADPFLHSACGRRYIYVEEFSYTLGKGILSVAEIDEDGRAGTPRSFLEENYHLSYPFVFEHAGETWMIPETSAANRIELYRAVDIPMRWQREAVLIDCITASDVTLINENGLWWMFACTHPLQSSSRDCLSLFSARNLLGPWVPHPQNPVVVDLRAARPGGHLYRFADALWRPAQDCSSGYGSALSLCRIETLNQTAFSQIVEATIKPGANWAHCGLHTLNCDGSIEVVDGLF